VLQLTPEGIELFDAAVADHAGSTTAASSRASEAARAFAMKELLDPEYIVLRALFRLLHVLTARPHPRYPYPKPSKATQRTLDRGSASRRPQASATHRATLSQLHGRVLHVARADHLDVVGHTAGGWGYRELVALGAGFTPEAFNATWEAVAAAIARGRRPARAD